MCLGSIARLVDAWDDRGARVGRLADGTIVSLAYVPAAQPGDHLLVHLGIPVEVLDAAAADEALALRSSGDPDDERLAR
jgi:hydrogenase assembly chaperone HypC/HupF